MSFAVTMQDPITVGSIANVVIETGEPVPTCTVANNSDPRCVVTLTNPEVSLSKALTGESDTVDGVAQPGEILTYTITLVNAGGAGTISVTETVPAGTTYAGGDDFVSACTAGDAAGTACTVTSPMMSAGGMTTMTFAVRVGAPITVLAVNNTVIETGEPQPTCTIANNSDPACVTTFTVPEISGWHRASRRDLKLHHHFEQRRRHCRHHQCD